MAQGARRCARAGSTKGSGSVVTIRQGLPGTKIPMRVLGRLPAQIQHRRFGDEPAGHVPVQRHQSPWNPTFVTSNVTTALKCADYCSTEIWETA